MRSEHSLVLGDQSLVLGGRSKGVGHEFDRPLIDRSSFRFASGRVEGRWFTILSKRSFANGFRLSVIEINNSSGKASCVPYEIRIAYGNLWEIHGIDRGICLNW
jgi:hypothetical protein